MVPITYIPWAKRQSITNQTEKEGSIRKGAGAYEWPGNVRELKNAIEYACVLCTERELQVRHLPPKIVPPHKRGPLLADGVDENLERENFLRILREWDGNQSEVARRLGVSRVTVWKRIKKFGIDLKRDL